MFLDFSDGGDETNDFDMAVKLIDAETVKQAAGEDWKTTGWDETAGGEDGDDTAGGEDGAVSSFTNEDSMESTGNTVPGGVYMW